MGASIKKGRARGLAAAIRYSFVVAISQRRACQLLTAILVVSSGVRLFFAWHFLGFLTGDDVEILETAFRTAFGLDYQPYEIRNLLLPDLFVSPLLLISGMMGVTSNLWMVRLGLLPFVVLGTISIWLVYRLAELWSQDRGVALLAAGLFSVHPLLLGYGSTSLPRNASTAAILAAAVLLSATGRDGVRAALAGALLSLAFAVRYSEVIFLVPLLAIAIIFGDSVRSRWVRATALVGGFLAISLITIGWMDQQSWGEPFASLREFTRYTLVEKRASTAVSRQPWDWYLRRMTHWLPFTMIPLLCFTRRRKALIAGWVFVLAPLAVLTLIHHKSLRYLQGVVPFLCVLGAAGALTLWRRNARKTVVVLLLGTALLGLRGGMRWQHRKSVPAMLAAQDLARQEPGGAVVVLSQAWGWGGKLLFGNDIEVRSLVHPVASDDLLANLTGASRVGLLADDLIGNPELKQIMEQHRLAQQKRYSWSRSQDAVVFGPANPGRELK